MSLPAELTYVTVVGALADGTNRSVVFRTPSWLIGSPFVPTFGVSATIAENGTFTASLPATDDPSWAPINWTYVVTISIDGQTQTGTLSVPAATTGNLSLAAVINTDVPADAGEVTYLLASARGTAGGVAALDADGDVNDAAGNKITGGGGGGASPGNTVVSETSYGQNASAGNATTYSRSNHTHGTPAAPAWTDVTSKPSTFTPALHASSHADGGADEISIDGSQVTSGTVAFARLPTGTGSTQVAIGNHTHAGGGGGTAVTSGRRTSGDLTTTSVGVFTVVSGWSPSIAAVSGDHVEITVSGLFDMTSSASEFFELCTLVSAAAVTYSSSGTGTPSTEGDPALYPSTNVRFRGSEVTFGLTVQSGDLSGGNVTFAFAHLGAGNAKVLASATYPLRWTIKNYGQ